MINIPARADIVVCDIKKESTDSTKFKKCQRISTRVKKKKGSAEEKLRTSSNYCARKNNLKKLFNSRWIVKRSMKVDIMATQIHTVSGKKDYIRDVVIKYIDHFYPE